MKVQKEEMSYKSNIINCGSIFFYEPNIENMKNERGARVNAFRHTNILYMTPWFALASLGEVCLSDSWLMAWVQDKIHVSCIRGGELLGWKNLGIAIWTVSFLLKLAMLVWLTMWAYVVDYSLIKNIVPKNISPTIQILINYNHKIK